MALDWIKAALEVARKADNVELERQLMDARSEFNDLREETFVLKTRVAQLEEELRQVRGGVFFREPWYYTTDGAGKEDGPFCPHCYDTKQQLVRAPRRHVGGGGVQQECPACNFHRWEREPHHPSVKFRAD